MIIEAIHKGHPQIVWDFWSPLPLVCFYNTKITQPPLLCLLLLDDPEPSELLEALERVEGDEVVDVDVGQPHLLLPWCGHP